MSLKISVITPSFNSGTTIDKAIRSVLDQEYTNYEHIIVDGGSTDNTVEILQKYPHLTWISEPDKGQANAMNKGFRMSQGEVIVYLNADDYFLCGAFSAVIPYFEQGESFVVGDIIVQMPTEYFINVPAVELTDMIRHWETNAFPSNPVGYFYLREVQKNIPFDETLDCMMDLQFLFECASMYNFKKINALLGVYRYLEATKTNADQKKAAYWSRDNFRLVDQYLSLMSPEYQTLYEKMRSLGYQNRRGAQSAPAEIEPRVTGKTGNNRNSAQQIGRAVLSRAASLIRRKKLLTLPSGTVINGKMDHHHYHIEENSPVFLIYQMGKVGSSSIYRALREQQTSSPVYQLHYLERKQLQESIRWHRKKDFPQLPDHLIISGAVADFMSTNQHKVRWKVISLVRDPIALQTSMIFQNLSEAFSSLLEDDRSHVNLQKAQKKIQQDLSDFKTRESHFLNWFDNEINKVFDINVFEYPFDKKEGYSIITSKNVSILLIKYEKLAGCFTDAFKKFSGIGGVQLPLANIGTEKEYGNDYKLLARSLKLPEPLCRDIYSSKLVRHFYSTQEINFFYRKWT